MVRFRGIPRHYLYDSFEEPWRTNPERLGDLVLLKLGQMGELGAGSLIDCCFLGFRVVRERVLLISAFYDRLENPFTIQ